MPTGEPKGEGPLGDRLQPNKGRHSLAQVDAACIDPYGVSPCRGRRIAGSGNLLQTASRVTTIHSARFAVVRAGAFLSPSVRSVRLDPPAGSCSGRSAPASRRAPWLAVLEASPRKVVRFDYLEV